MCCIEMPRLLYVLIVYGYLSNVAESSRRLRQNSTDFNVFAIKNTTRISVCLSASGWMNDEMIRLWTWACRKHHDKYLKYSKAEQRKHVHETFDPHDVSPRRYSTPNSPKIIITRNAMNDAITLWVFMPSRIRIWWIWRCDAEALRNYCINIGNSLVSLEKNPREEQSKTNVMRMEVYANWSIGGSGDCSILWVIKRMNE